MKICNKCGEEKPVEQFSASSRDGTYATCKTCRNADQRQWRSENPEKDREYRLKRHHLTPDSFIALLESQNGRCAICPAVEPGGSGYWHVDHDHACCPGEYSCGECIRGLLCFSCNTGLGKFGDSADRLIKAAKYLRGIT